MFVFSSILPPPPPPPPPYFPLPLGGGGGGGGTLRFWRSSMTSRIKRVQCQRWLVTIPWPMQWSHLPREPLFRQNSHSLACAMKTPDQKRCPLAGRQHAEFLGPYNEIPIKRDARLETESIHHPWLVQWRHPPKEMPTWRKTAYTGLTSLCNETPAKTDSCLESHSIQHP